MLAPLRMLLLLMVALAASLAAAETSYPPVKPSAPLVFPRDFGAHPQFRVEWWYLTGWLDSDKAATLPKIGFQLTFFRLRPGLQENNPSVFSPRQLVIAHAAISDPKLGRLRSAEKSARAGFGLASADTGDMSVNIDDWLLRREAGAYLARVRSEAFAYELTATPTILPVLQGNDGFSRKAADPRYASYYYSQPQLDVRGWIELDGSRRMVTGRAWLDHEWSSEMMPPQAVGWDWLSVNLHDGGALMAFRMRGAAGNTLWAGGSLQTPGQAPQTLGPADIAFTPRRQWRSPRSGGDYPVEMTVRAGQKTLRLMPLMDDQELDSRRSTGALYWEGAVRALSEDSRELGQGYLELTGYAGRVPLR
jgi:predicted secreted hydrolase